MTEAPGPPGPAAAGPAPLADVLEIRNWRIVPALRARIVTVAEARAIDQAAAERYAMPSLLLMERAALGLEVVALDMLSERPGPIVALCGPGANGGDAFAVARMLHDRALPVSIVAISGAGAVGDAAINRAIARQRGVEISDRLPQGPAPALSIDGLFGTGLTRSIEGFAAELVGWANSARRQGARVLAIDVPSGMDASAGTPLGPAIEADTTVTFVGVKPGLASAQGRARAGRIIVAPIGAPPCGGSSLTARPVS
jgi:NAD(P)H-hydrate epimerase